MLHRRAHQRKACLGFGLLHNALNQVCVLHLQDRFRANDHDGHIPLEAGVECFVDHHLPAKAQALGDPVAVVVLDIEVLQKPTSFYWVR